MVVHKLYTNTQIVHKFWSCYAFLVWFVRFIDTGLRKFDRYKHVQSASTAWNVLLLGLGLRAYTEWNERLAENSCTE